MNSDKQLETIINRCRAGERDAFEALFEQYQPRLKYYVRRLDGDGGKTDDILQDIWTAVVEKIGTLKKPQLFPVWLYRIARNRVYTGFRQKKRLARLPEEKELPVSNNNEPALDTQDINRLHQALKKTKPHHREVLTLYFLEQMSYQSIADVIGCSIGTVRSRIFHAKKSIREKMEKHNG